MFSGTANFPYVVRPTPPTIPRHGPHHIGRCGERAVDAKLVARVQAAAKELGYLPDPAAGACPIRGKVRS